MEKILVTRSSMPDYEEYCEMIKPLWNSHFLTNMGVYHKQLTSELCKFLNIENVSLMVNGHLSLEMALQALELPEGGEVITTPFTFISTTHAIVRNKLKPVFCDVKEDFTIDENRIEDLITEKTVAIVPVHVYGNICNVEKIEEIAYRYNLRVVYDAAHAFGEEYKGNNIARFGDMSTFSFHATKVFNTIEGGAVCSKNHEYYEKLYNIKNFGIRSEESIVYVGANAKMNEFAAAMGICNLRHLEEEIGKRKKAVERYNSNLGNVFEIKLNRYSDDTKPNYAYYPVLFQNKEMRNIVYERLKEYDIFSRKYFYPITADAACFKNKFKTVDLIKARDYSNRILVLPLYADLQMEQVDKICDCIKNIISEI